MIPNAGKFHPNMCEKPLGWFIKTMSFKTTNKIYGKDFGKQMDEETP